MRNCVLCGKLDVENNLQILASFEQVKRNLG